MTHKEPTATDATPLGRLTIFANETNNYTIRAEQLRPDVRALLSSMEAKPDPEGADGKLVERLNDMRDFCEYAARNPHPSASNGPHPNNVAKLCQDVLAALAAKPSLEPIRTELVEDAREALQAMMDAWFDYHDAHSLTQPVTGAAGNAFDKALAARDAIDALLSRNQPGGSDG